MPQPQDNAVEDIQDSENQTHRIVLSKAKAGTRSGKAAIRLGFQEGFISAFFIPPSAFSSRRDLEFFDHCLHRGAGGLS